MTRERPYMHHRIAQLEAVLDRAGLDPETLRTLAHELSLRKTDRAARLRAKVAERMRGMASARPSPAPGRGSTPNASQLVQGRDRRETPATEARQAKTASAAVPSLESEPQPPSSPPAAVLGAWTALEVLSPQTYRRPEDLASGERGAIARLVGDILPCQGNERSRRNYQLFYQLCLGTIPMDRAAERMAAAFGADEERASRQGEKAVMAFILVDRHGVPLEGRTVALSSFAWGLPLALRRDFARLGGWIAAETALVGELEMLVRRADREGRPLPLDRATIDKAHRWLVERFGLPADLVEPPAFALRTFHYYKAKNPPEPALVNSFFLGDLARAATLLDENRLPSGLARYLGAMPPPAPVDLLVDRGALEAIVAPGMMPLARWPGPGGHPLVMLQQAAVNAARSDLAGGEGLIAVNGPPGTGKTTLLRDLVAACVLDRATAMAAFDDPDAAFTVSGERMSAGEKASFRLYRLHDSLKGNEILVASSNNKAVENISRELPSAAAIGRPPDEMGYFASVANALQRASASRETDDVSVGANPDPDRSWGLIAAVLGNRANLAAFQQTFWWDDERGFRLYLKAAKGDTVEREIRDTAGHVTDRRPPAIVAQEQPPTPNGAKEAWRAARERFLSLKQTVEQELVALEAVRELCLAFEAARRDAAEAEARIAPLMARQQAAEMDHRQTGAYARQAQLTLDRDTRAAQESRRNKPGWLAQLVRSQRWRDWRDAHAPLAAAAARAANMRAEASRRLAASASAREQASAALQAAQTRLTETRQRAEALDKQLKAHRDGLGDRIVDERLFGHGHEAAHLTAPWCPDSLHRKREDLFIAALGLHRAFIDAAARPVHHNLSALMDVFSSGAPSQEGRRKLLGDLWSTFFLTVPVVSTTFASSDRMLGALPTGSIGWLLIDEAGQALPQAAVGTIQRVRRTVVTGDPRQIPPVVTLPDHLTTEICRRFGVDPARWAAPQASAQSVADRASRFHSTSEEERGPSRIGLPLLVHRRCQQPMFGLFNRIAYGGKMVHATPRPKPSPIEAAWGTSRWIDVQGPADTKWCPAEGETVVALLKQLAAAGTAKPDLFIVSPFRVVAHELRRRLEEERGLFAALGLDARPWLKDHVGTVHTVQGREADAVLLVLGAPNPSQRAARQWAAEPPNILNVAISRARQHFYVIGSHEAWSSIGHARELRTLPTIRLDPDDATPITALRHGQEDGLTDRPYGATVQRRRGPQP